MEECNDLSGNGILLSIMQEELKWTDCMVGYYPGQNNTIWEILRPSPVRDCKKNIFIQFELDKVYHIPMIDLNSRRWLIRHW